MNIIGGENMFSQLKKEKKMKSFFRGEGGAVAILFALALLPILGFLGLTIDIGQIYQLHAIVSGAVDSAALAGARAGGSNSNMTQHAIAIFNANIPSNKSWTVTAPTVSISSDSKTITVSATITSPTTFMTLFGQNSISAAATSQAQVSTQGAEVVLVLDNTGSMYGGPMSDLLAGAKNLVNILYGSATVDTVSGLYVGVVPYSTTININMTGFTPTNWITTVGRAQINNSQFLYPNIAPTSTSVGGRWMGCIEARTPAPSGITSSQYTTMGYTNYASGMDSTDTPPTSDGTKFTPYLYPSTMAHQYIFGKPLNRGTTSTSNASQPITTGPQSGRSPPWGKNGNTRGDNDWTLSGGVPSGSGLHFGDNYQWVGSDGNLGVGPNLGCPVAMLPLTASQTTVQNKISQMKATFRGGTMASLGLNAGWWILSPNWRGMWPGVDSSLPKNYEDTLKIIVLMTDGQNQWYDWPDGVPGDPDTSHNYAADADYTGYGRLAEGRLGTTNFTTAQTVVNTKMSNMCTTLKNNGVTIYTIIYTHGASINSATQSLYQGCATAPASEHYFFAATSTDLENAFSNIGKSISSLRLNWPGKP